jgi:hypothetical protein
MEITTDFIYKERLERLEKLYQDGLALVKENQRIWDKAVDDETCNVIMLNLLADTMYSTEETLRVIKEKMNVIKLEISN